MSDSDTQFCLVPYQLICVLWVWYNAGFLSHTIQTGSDCDTQFCLVPYQLICVLWVCYNAGFLSHTIQCLIVTSNSVWSHTNGSVSSDTVLDSYHTPGRKCLIVTPCRKCLIVRSNSAWSHTNQSDHTFAHQGVIVDHFFYWHLHAEEHFCTAAAKCPGKIL